eukprot:7335884-Pyramimonas_sp.AAC.1
MHNSSWLRPEAGRKGGLGVSLETSSPSMTLSPKHWQPFHRWRAGRFQHVSLIVAPRAFVFEVRKSFTY